MNTNVSENGAAVLNEARRQRIEGLREEHGPQSMEHFRPGTSGCHELLDRTHLLGDMVERFLCEHPACVQDADWFRLAAQAAESLHELYQRVGAAHLADDAPADEA